MAHSTSSSHSTKTWSSSDQWILITSLIIEELVTIDLEVVLHLREHGGQHLAKRGVHEDLGQVDYVAWDAFTDEELRAFVSEVIAVVLQHIVGFLCKAGAYFS